MFQFEKIIGQTLFGNKIESYLWFIGIVLFGTAFLRFFSRTFSRLLFKLFKRFAADVRAEKFVELLVKPIELFLITFISYLAVNQLDYPLKEIIFERKDTKVQLISVIDHIFLFFIIFSIIWIILRIIDFIALAFAYKASLTESKADDQLVPFVKELVKIVTVIIGVFVMLGMVFQINVLTLITGLGIGGIAVALAAKESLENLLGSFTIFFDKPFVVGDLVKVNNIEGTVEKVGFRSTLLRAPDKSLITVPNKKMIDSALENLTLKNFRRLKFVIDLSYNTKPEVLKKITAEIEEHITSIPGSSKDGISIFEEFGESSLKVMVLYYIEMLEYREYLRIRERVNYKIAEIVYANGADFAFPTRVVYHQPLEKNGTF